MKRRLQALAFCCLTVFVSFSGWSQEIQIPVLDLVSETVIFNQDVWNEAVSAQNISTVTMTKKVLLADDFLLAHQSKITGFHFFGQFGTTVSENLPPVLGVHLYVIKNSSLAEMVLPDAYIAHFYLEEGNPGLGITRENEKTSFHVDLGLAGEELILEGQTTYWLAFAPEVNTIDLPEDQMWYWYTGDGGSHDPRRLKTGATSWENDNVPFALAFSIEGENEVLGRSDFGKGTVSEKVFPNPSNGIFTIASDKEITSVEVYTLTGQLLLKGNSPKADLTDYPNGVYLLVVNYADGYSSNRKLIKN
ncbi:T9SS type A sorting domain-containing protein [Flavobacterium cerinum]|uniref:T9SS type A sorting domain-containing protein n=1 Tax=Flavobacterium cerinum TaxID=2502784 RepID=A0ABY5IZU6_9FLAO|nr:T9SS type A sorting domain-containing protein [Flavobacterium cerinum]UUC47253.1 T9SS type A sorting domain-containing protein [Flavobacterium cerinum]